MKIFDVKNISAMSCLGLLLAMLLAACSPLSESEPPLRVGTNVWPGYEPLYLARKLNAWGDAPVRLVEFNSATDVAHAMRNGSLEATALTLDEAISLLQDGINIRVILVMDFSSGGDALLARPGIQTLDQLRGKRVAVENTAVGAIMLNGALQYAGIEASDVQILSCTVDKHEACYQQADAVVTFEPVKSRLLEQGAVLLFDSSKLDQIVDVLVATEDALTRNPETLHKLLRGYFMAREYMQSHPHKVAAMMAPRMGLPADKVEQTFEGLRIPDLAENRTLLTGQPPGVVKIAEQITRVMLQHKLLRQQVDVSHIAEGKLLDEIQP